MFKVAIAMASTSSKSCSSTSSNVAPSSKQAQRNAQKRMYRQFDCLRKIVRATCERKTAKATEKSIIRMVPKVQTALKAVGDAEWAGATVPLQRALSTFMSVREVSVDSLSVPDDKIQQYVSSITVDIITFSMKLNELLSAALPPKDLAELALLANVFASKGFIETGLSMHDEMAVLEELFEQFLKSCHRMDVEKV